VSASGNHYANDKTAGQTMNKVLREEAMRLPADERVELALELWDSLADHEVPPPTDEQIAEAERRLAEYQKNPDRAVSWQEVMKRIRARFK
jgi:putative addiction module component (TIGR02574 family)